MTAALPLAVAVVPFGMSFGVLARSAGMGRLAPVVMSATTFAGSAQFAAASILGAGGGLAAAIVAAVLLNVRYGPIGLSVAGVLRGGPLARFVQAQLVVDESWAVANRGGRFDRRLLLGAGAVLYASWLLGTVAGVLAGDLLGDPERLGLDAAFPALFLALLVPQLRVRGDRSQGSGSGPSGGTAPAAGPVGPTAWLRSHTALVAAVLGAAIAICLVLVSPPGVPIIAASVACLVGACRPTTAAGATPTRRGQEERP
ncbi:MAG TPA: AzlC family ABC transporter permease [Actinomycetes bacterium]|nr:AzlC family ABC transporter permease [Actinomycetes bacterium]